MSSLRRDAGAVLAHQSGSNTSPHECLHGEETVLGQPRATSPTLRAAGSAQGSGSPGLVGLVVMKLSPGQASCTLPTRPHPRFQSKETLTAEGKAPKLRATSDPKQDSALSQLSYFKS